MKKFIVFVLMMISMPVMASNTEWVLVTTKTVTIPNPVYDGRTQPATLTVPPNTIIAVIVYDGISDYDAPPNTELYQTDDTAKIGDIIN